ncbi:Os09g0537100 [Oryza sativa Japonica Group]|uniref:Os09g0537100 protein n=2 Tax=Oryza TaxID=4527 RepID=Q0J011_ORYSJ|nr:Os09g0537100 [Oryza sativa Japonica Group]|eukprot:NP_001063790.1 Os09g0537100 [Oryza sativa Japonica Group]
MIKEEEHPCFHMAGAADGEGLRPMPSRRSLPPSSSDLVPATTVSCFWLPASTSPTARSSTAPTPQAPTVPLPASSTLSTSPSTARSAPLLPRLHRLSSCRTSTMTRLRLSTPKPSPF